MFIEYDLIVPIESNKLRSSSLWYLIYFLILLCKWNWPICNEFLDLFSNLFSFFFFFKLWLSFLFKIQNNKNNQTEGREEKKKKKSY